MSKKLAEKQLRQLGVHTDSARAKTFLALNTKDDTIAGFAAEIAAVDVEVNTRTSFYGRHTETTAINASHEEERVFEGLKRANLHALEYVYDRIVS